MAPSRSLLPCSGRAALAGGRWVGLLALGALAAGCTDGAPEASGASSGGGGATGSATGPTVEATSGDGGASKKDAVAALGSAGG